MDNLIILLTQYINALEQKQQQQQQQQQQQKPVGLVYSFTHP